MYDRRVLISTIAPVSGGVPTMTYFVVDTLIGQGWTPVLAHYEPYSITPKLSVPFHRLLQRYPTKQVRSTWNEIETHAIGAWLPELEFTHYKATQIWCELMDSCSRFVAVCGNVLAALPFADTNRPFTAWVATGWSEDRIDRVLKFSSLRKCVDRWVNTPVLLRQERAILQKGNILPLSHHTKGVLNQLAQNDVCGNTLPMPIDSQYFGLMDAQVIPKRIGFSGRLDDPRKNIGLLIDVIHRLVRNDPNVTAVLVGGKLDARLSDKIRELGLSSYIKCIDYLPRNRLRKLLQSLDVFVLPSHQEGLCISALEAMATGCPVVSTRCGGPEEYVIQGETGYLVDFDASEMSDAIQRIVSNQKLRTRLSKAARQLVVEKYSTNRCTEIFLDAFENQAKETGV